MKIHPWNEQRWQQLMRIRNTLPHALLLSGNPGSGKNNLAQMLAMSLLCQQSDQEACQRCHSCHLFLAGSHPDFHVLSAGESKIFPDILQRYRKRYEEDESKSQKVKMQIPVARIHRLTEALFSSAHTSEYKVALISPAESLNIYAANALLKFLEEPVGETYLLLVSDQPDRLPTTIRSRCTPAPFYAPHFDQVAQWLKQQLPELDEDTLQNLFRRAGQSPLATITLAKQRQQESDCAADLAQLLDHQISACEISEKWQRQKTMAENLQHLQRLLAEKIRQQSIDSISQMSGRSQIKMPVLFDGYERTGRALRDIYSGLDSRLLVEDILVALKA